MKLVAVFILAVTGLLLIRCEAPNPDGVPTDAASVLDATRSKMLTIPTHHYRYTSLWDNRFAASTYTDTMDITYSWLPDSELGFGFHAAGSGHDILYDGKDKLEIDHNKRKVVRTTAAEIGKDAAYFAHLMCFHGDPKALPEAAAFNRVMDTIIGGKPLYAYSRTTRTPAVEGLAKDVVSTSVYYLDPERLVVDRIRNFSHVGRDTSQIIDYFFSDYVFTDGYRAFGAPDRTKSLAYREISKADDKQERRSGLIRPGAQLHRADYTDINDQERLIYGQAGKKAVVMFGFIGCGGCEYAFLEMKKRKFAVRGDINLIYSSPVNEASALQPYLKKKGFPFTGFGKGSRMNDNFKVAGFPTFVLIDDQGKVERVIGGYDEEVGGILFE